MITKSRSHVAGAVLIASVLAACQGSASSNSPVASQAASSSPTSVASTSAAPTAASLSGTLRVQEWAPGGTALWTSLKQAFEAKYPGVTVQLEEVPFPNYNDKVASYVALGDGPDVFFMETGPAINQFKGSLMPLNGKVDDVFNNLNSTWTGCENWDCSKTVWGLPFSMQGHPIYYNKSVLTAAGLSAPPTSFKELETACTKIKALGKECFAMASKGGFGTAILWLALPNYTASTDQILGLATGATKMTDPSIGSATVILKWMFDQGWFPKNVVTLNLSPDAQNMFEKGGAGFFVGWLGDAVGWQTLDKSMGTNYDVMAWPKLEDGDIPGVVPGPNNGKIDTVAATSVVMAKWTKNPDAALAFMKWATGPDAAGMVGAAGDWPAAKSWDPSSINSVVLQHLAEVAKNGGAGPYLMMSLRAVNELVPQTDNLLLGKSTPDQVNAAFEKANEIR
jgi:ABC-type glycerol-3-phosphate transport system substrate-binding protein